MRETLEFCLYSCVYVLRSWSMSSSQSTQPQAESLSESGPTWSSATPAGRPASVKEERGEPDPSKSLRWTVQREQLLQTLPENRHTLDICTHLQGMEDRSYGL